MKNMICSKNHIRKKCFLLLVLIAAAFFNLSSVIPEHTLATDPTPINDGPYIFLEEDIMKARWIENSQLREEDVSISNYDKIRQKFNLLNSFNDLRYAFIASPRFRQYYDDVDSIAIISDTHGEYDIYINLLRKNGIIDDKLTWKFGKGHLVVLGDVFDRGDKVTEIFWHLFGLERQAAKSGGRVHFLLGNHELMILSRATGYIHNKYKNVENIAGRYYCDLYSENSVLGSWLRNKPVVISINDILFVHAGLSKGMMHREMKIEKINRTFFNRIIGKDYAVIEEDEELFFLNDENGPVWYRGYHLDNSLCEKSIDSILTFYEKKHIVIGHTVTKEIVTLFNKKVIGCDTGIMYRKPGEMLIIKKGSFYRGLCNGKRLLL